MTGSNNPALDMAVEALIWAKTNLISGIDTLEGRAIFRLSMASIPFYVQEAIQLIEQGVAKLPDDQQSPQT